MSSLPRPCSICDQATVARRNVLPDVGRDRPRPYLSRDRFRPESGSLTMSSSRPTMPLMQALRQPVISSYGVPVLSVGVVLLIGRWLDIYLHAAPVSLFICAVTLSAWFGGFRSGLLAMLLSILAFKY